LFIPLTPIAIQLASVPKVTMADVLVVPPVVTIIGMPQHVEAVAPLTYFQVPVQDDCIVVVKAGKKLYMQEPDPKVTIREVEEIDHI